MKRLRLGTLHVAHTGEGALLTLADCRADGPSLAAAMGPDSWPTGAALDLAADAALPFYVERMDTGRRLEGACAWRGRAGQPPRRPAALQSAASATRTAPPPLEHSQPAPCCVAGCWQGRSRCSRCA